MDNVCLPYCNHILFPSCSLVQGCFSKVFLLSFLRHMSGMLSQSVVQRLLRDVSAAKHYTKGTAKQRAACVEGSC